MPRLAVLDRPKADDVAMRLSASGRPASRRRPKDAVAAQVLAHLPVAVFVLDASLRLHYWNERASVLMGVPSMLREATPPLTDLLAGSGLAEQHRARLAEFCRQRMNDETNGAPENLLRLAVSRNGRLAARLVPMRRGRWVLTVDDRDTSETGAASADAWLDALTGLSNRRRFHQVLEEAIAGLPPEAPISLLIIGLDRFKIINDTWGQPAGDALLCLVAQRLRREVRDMDLLARLGGDEFVILARDTMAAEPLAKRVLEVLSRPFQVEGNILRIGASIGIACAPAHRGTADDLIHRASIALREAKATGRGAWHLFQPELATTKGKPDPSPCLVTDTTQRMTDAEAKAPCPDRVSHPTPTVGS